MDDGQPNRHACDNTGNRNARWNQVERDNSIYKKETKEPAAQQHSPRDPGASANPHRTRPRGPTGCSLTHLGPVLVEMFLGKSCGPDFEKSHSVAVLDEGTRCATAHVDPQAAQTPEAVKEHGSQGWFSRYSPSAQVPQWLCLECVLGSERSVLQLTLSFDVSVANSQTSQHSRLFVSAGRCCSEEGGVDSCSCQATLNHKLPAKHVTRRSVPLRRHLAKNQTSSCCQGSESCRPYTLNPIAAKTGHRMPTFGSIGFSLAPGSHLGIQVPKWHLIQTSPRLCSLSVSCQGPT